MTEAGLTQKDLAEALGVTIDRVKGLSSGRAKKLAPDEAKALVVKLHVRPGFLATGTPPVMQGAKELEVERRLALLQQASTAAGSFDMPKDYQLLVQQILFGTGIRDESLVRSAIDSFLTDRINLALPPKSAPTKKR